MTKSVHRSSGITNRERFAVIPVVLKPTEKFISRTSADPHLRQSTPPLTRSLPFYKTATWVNKNNCREFW